MSPDDKIRYEEAVRHVRNIEDMIKFIGAEPGAVCDKEKLLKQYNDALDELMEFQKFAAVTGEDSV